MRAELEHRPLLIAAAALTLGLVMPRELPLVLLWLAGFFFLRSMPSRALWSVAALLGVLLAPEPPGVGVTENVYVDREATVAAVPDERPDFTFTLFDFGSMKVMVILPPHFHLDLGDRVHVRGVITPLNESSDAHWLEQGVLGHLTLEAGQVQFVSHASWIFQVSSSWRNGVISFANRALPEDESALIGALCFSARGMVDNNRSAALKSTGIIHIAAASGLHVIILGAMAQAFLVLLPIPRAVVVGLVALLLGLYAIAAGLHPPVIRAGLMATAGSFAYLFRRESDSLSSLSLAAIAVLLWTPASVFDIGFHISFLVVGGLAFYGSRQSDASIRGELKQSVRSGLVASAAAAPIVAFNYGAISLIGFAANIVAVLVAGPIVVLSMLGWIFSSFAEGVGRVLMRLAGTLANGLGAFLDTLGPLPWTSIDVPRFSAYWLLVMYGVPLLFWRKHLRQP